VITALDTNILLDILIPDEEFLQSSKNLLDRYNEKGQLIICEVVYSELASQFSSEEEIKDFLSDTRIRLIYSNEQSLFLAAQRWKAYASSRKAKNKFLCPKCGHNITAFCLRCKHPVLFRQHIISDFIIGAHAVVQADLLLSRDRGFFRRYFKELKIGC